MNDEKTTSGGPVEIVLGAETPETLLARDDLDREQKIATLRQWELDLRERMVAEEENMPATEPLQVSLEEVLDALACLGAGAEFHPVPTTHG